MSIIDTLEPLAVQWREKKIPIIRLESAKWLRSIVEKHKPKRILELGTAVGYSGTILAAGSTEYAGASLVTIDQDANALKVAEETFAQFNVDAQIIEEDVIDALKDIVTLGLIPGDFDVIFIDHMKAKYFDSLEYCMKLSKKGTIIIADNVKNPKCAKFVAAIKTDARLDTQIIDIDDGVSISIVK